MSAFAEATDDGTDEQFLVGGEAPDVLDADRQAWESLIHVLGKDPLTAWRLGRMIHSYVPLEGGGPKVEWAATFVRNPEAPTPSRPQVSAEVETHTRSNEQPA